MNKSDATTAVNFLKRLTTDELTYLGGLINSELLLRKYTGPTKDELVEKFGLDGQKQVGATLRGYRRDDLTNNLIHIQRSLTNGKAKFLLEELPFPTMFDEDYNGFVFTPTVEELDWLRKVLDPNYCEMLSFNSGIGILIDPDLGKQSNVIYVHDQAINATKSTVTLAQLVELYLEYSTYQKARPVFEPAPYYPGFYQETSDKTSILEFKGKSLVRKIEWNHFVFESAPFRTGVTFNATACSNANQLIEAGKLPVTAHLDKSPIVDSVFVRIGDSLIRVMTRAYPGAQFTKSIEHISHDELLELHVAVNLTNKQVDCFGNVIQWAGLLKEPGLDLEISLDGFFNSTTGIIGTNKGIAKLIPTDVVGDVVTSLLGKELEVIGFTLSGTIVP